MKRLLPYLVLLVLPHVEAQTPPRVDSTARLTYRFRHPQGSALEIAKSGLPTLDGVLVSIDLQRGDTVAEITGRVRDETWNANLEVWGGAPGHKQIYFGRIRDYLRGDPRFRILVHPSWCVGCEGFLEAVFLPNNDEGYLVGPPR